MLEPSRARRAPILAALGLAPLLGLSCSHTAPGSAPRPNLLFIVVDTLRADRLGCYGNPRPMSAHLDALAHESFVFESAQSSAPWTAPALLTLMTGLYPDAHGVRAFPDPERLHEGVTTLAELLADRGYTCAAYTEGGYAKGDFGLDQGFEHYERQQGDDESHVSNLFFPSRLAANVEKSLAWLRAHRGEPFFLFFHTYEPHFPYAPEQRWLDAIGSDIDLAREEASLREVVGDWNAGRALSGEDWLLVARHRHHCDLVDAEPVERRPELEAALANSGLLQPGDAASPLVPFVRDLYDAEIAAADAQLARLFDALEELGSEPETIVVVASDHGESLGEHGELGHGLLLSEVVLRMVLVVRAPMLDAEPRRVADVVRSVDVLPTLVEVMTLDADDLPLQGRSLVPAMRGERMDEPAFSHATSGDELRGRFHAVRTERWRYVVQTDGPGRWLFDLAADPTETRDVRGEHRDVAAQLEELLQRQMSADARLRERNPATPLPALPRDPDLEKLGYTGSDEKR